MGIDAVLQKLISMTQQAGIPIPDEDLKETQSIEFQNPDPTIVYAVFKKFAYMTFDCSHFSSGEEENYECIEWQDECILLECGVNAISVDGSVALYGNVPTFYFDFRRAFTIKFTHGGRDTLYSDLITCSLDYELNDELADARKTVEYVFPPYNEPSGLNEFFAEIEALDVYPLVMNKYRPKSLIIEQSD